MVNTLLTKGANCLALFDLARKRDPAFRGTETAFNVVVIFASLTLAARATGLLSSRAWRLIRENLIQNGKLQKCAFGCDAIVNERLFSAR